MPLANIQGKFIVRTGGGGLTAPSTPSISSVTGSGFTVSWTAVTGAIGYRLDISTNSNFSSFVAGYNSKAVSGTSEVVTGLSSETTYYVRLKTVGVSANSGSVSETTEAQTSTLTNGLLAFYKLSDTSDSSGNGNTLTNNGGVTFASGKIGNAAVFDGSSDFQLDLDLTQANALSVSFWWLWDQSIDGSNILSGPINAYVYPSDNFAIDLSDGGLNTTVLTNLTTGVWRHCTLVADDAGRSVFINGTMVASNQTPYTNYGNVTQNIGRHPSYPSQYQFFGKLDALGIWSRTLTNTEITELYNAGTGLEIN